MAKTKKDDPTKRNLVAYAHAIKAYAVRMTLLAEALRAYYDQHQATKPGCDCALCKRAEQEFRKTLATGIKEV